MAGRPYQRSAWGCASLALVAAIACAAAADPPDQLPTTFVTGAPANQPQSSGPPPNPVQRIAATFDFEEPDNPYPVPRHWSRAQDTERAPRPGFPRFNQAEFDFDVAYQGEASLRLPTRGGSTSARLATGVIPIFADGDYEVSAWVRTAGLEHSRAFLVARLLDQAGAPLPGSEISTPPIRTQGSWTHTSVQLISIPPAAVYMQLELQLLQPRQFDNAGDAPEHHVWSEDLTGAAWFDDVVVFQLPRVELTTGAPANIVLLPARPSLRILVRDFVGERLDGELELTDIDGAVVERSQLSLATSGRPQEWTPTLPALGWYHATMRVIGEKPGGERYRVGESSLSFLWLGPIGDTASRAAVTGSRTDRSRFGIIADRADTPTISLLPDVGRRIGAGLMVVPVWDSAATPATVRASLSTLGSNLQALARAGQQVMLAIPSIPRAILADHQVAADDPLALATLDPLLWMPFLDPVLDQYGQRMTRWQIGLVGADAAFWRDDVPAAARTFATQLGTLVPGPRVAIPWRREFALPPALLAGPEQTGIGFLMMQYPAAFSSTLLRDDTRALFSSAQGPEEPTEIWIVPELPDTAVFGERAEVTELGRRVCEFWAARSSPDLLNAPGGVAINHPWSGESQRRPQVMPAASLGALRTLIHHLAERRVIGEYLTTPGVRCYILADRATGAGNGALVAWTESADPATARITRFLGDGPIQVVDLFGNRTPVRRTAEPGGPHSVPIGETPVFIEGVDPLLASFCAQVAIEPGFLPAIQTEHELSLVLTNPWPQSISGKFQIIPPISTDRRRRWQITPDAIQSFTLGPGQTKRIPWAVAFPYFEETGDKEFSVVVRLETDNELPPIVLPLTLQVGLKDLELSPEVQLGPRLDGPDIIITASITNRGARSRMLKLDAVGAGIPTHQTLIPDLLPGETIIKRVVLKGAAAGLSGKRVFLSLSDTEDQERIGMSVLVP